MRLIECYIEGFGKLSKKKYDFSSGFNCINEENGSGKTTLATFIKVMLYGMSDTKKASLEENDRKHYMPWSGGACGGALTFETNKKIYRVERSFALKAADDSFMLYDLTLGKISEDFSEKLGEELFGIDADGFERTVFLSERALSPKSDNKSISAKLSDLVGCDGDICDMDEALKALESARKFYYKKGGSGDLSETKGKIGEITRKLEELEEIEHSLSAAEKKLIEARAKGDLIRKETRALEKERESATLRVAEAGYEKLHREMKASLEDDLKRHGELVEFFGGNPPSFDDIDDAYYKSVEAKSLLDGAESSSKSTEYTELRAYFSIPTSDEEIARVKTAIDTVSQHKNAQSSPEYTRLKSIFKKRIPSESEIDELISVKKKKSKAPLLSILGAILAAVGAIIGVMTPLAFLLILPAAALIGVSVGVSAKYHNEHRKRECEFFASLSDKPAPDGNDTLTVLYEMRALLDDARKLLDDEKIEDDRAAISELESRFPCGDSADVIISKYERFKALLVAEQYIEGDRSAKIERAKMLLKEANGFIARFPTVSDDPYTELRRILTEYNMLSSKILSKRGEIEHLASLHSLGEGTERKAEKSVEEIDERRRSLEEEAAAISRDIALTERICKGYESELESRDELIMRRAELEERLVKNEENYNVILLTKKYLQSARDNMTVKYLGKTKSAFEKYAEAISGVNGEEFLMDTDFGVSITDGGKAHPQDAYSRGTRDLYNIAARLALVDSLYEGEKPFIVLDDPFCSLDDKKTRAALELLRRFAKERQIIYFTCSSSREA
ncbi:MAG: hypothetical protein E7676_06415 [Ruminococcaceae bacterium]|nr:hypothetical protein [Oscillospiraceae bacterium]